MLITPPSELLVPSTSLDQALTIVAGYRPTEAAQEHTRDRILDFVEEHPDALTRGCAPGHLTGSALVVDHTGARALLLLHAKLGKWLQPGGHADGDGNLVHVAWQEATEETGIADLAIWSLPIDVDIHRVAPPGEAAHDHLDVRFLVVAPPGAVTSSNHESLGMQWVERLRLGDVSGEPGLHRLAAAGFARFDALA